MSMLAIAKPSQRSLSLVQESGQSGAEEKVRSNPSMVIETGFVVKVVYKKPESHWGIARVELEDRVIWIKGELLPLHVGACYQFGGWWEEDERWGDGMRVRFIKEIIPTTPVRLVRYLTGLRLPQLTPARCEALVQRWGVRCLRVIEEDPLHMEELGLEEEACARIQQAWMRRLPSRSLLACPEAWGLTDQQARALFDIYGGKTLPLLRRNPYLLARHVGLGFSVADQLAERLGIRRQDPRRVRAGLLSILEEAATQEGHTMLPRQELLARTRSRKLQLDASLAEELLLGLEAEGHVLSDPSGNLIGLSEFREAEREIAKQLLRFAQFPVERPHHPSPAGLHPEQDQAVQAAQRHRCMVLTGSPGTGKTFTLRAILECGWEKPMLAATTGKAARRLSDMAGLPAFTLHRLLEVQPKRKGFQGGRQEPIDADLLIVDEASMLDIPLAHALLRSIDPARTHLVLCGDADQLPPVGAGDFLADLIQSGAIPVVRLQQIVRQQSNSQIIPNARRVLDGDALLVNNQKYTDFKFLSVDATTQVIEEKEFLRHLREAFDSLTAHGYTPEDIQVLSPMKKGAIPGAQALNKTLQHWLNPASSKKPEIRSHQRFREGDRVIQLRNNYELGVFNGDTGVIHKIGDDWLTVQFDDRIVTYEVAQLSQLELAYAISIHKSQGSEWPIVIVPLCLIHRNMLSRRLLYTAMTRAKKLLILIGSDRAVGYTISQEDEDLRYTTLYAWLRKAHNDNRAVEEQEDSDYNYDVSQELDAWQASHAETMALPDRDDASLAYDALPLPSEMETTQELDAEDIKPKDEPPRQEQSLAENVTLLVSSALSEQQTQPESHAVPEKAPAEDELLDTNDARNERETQPEVDVAAASTQASSEKKAPPRDAEMKATEQESASAQGLSLVASNSPSAQKQGALVAPQEHDEAVIEPSTELNIAKPSGEPPKDIFGDTLSPLGAALRSRAAQKRPNTAKTSPAAEAANDKG